MINSNTKKMSQDEAKANLVTMLKNFDILCRNNNIKYSLIGGSLIGAIRHQGIIPWDDDIDIIMVKSEYEKLINILEKRKYLLNDKYMFMNYDNNKTYYYPFLKMIDLSTFTYEEKFKEIDNYGQFIDIFYYNYAPNNKIKRKIFWYKIMFARTMITGYATKNVKKYDKYYIIKKIGAFLIKIFGIKNLLRWYEKSTNKNNKYKTNYLISNWPIYNMKKETQKASDFDDYINCNFEGIEAMIIKNYDSVLKNTFGDYMELPPVEKRMNHGLCVYKKDIFVE